MQNNTAGISHQFHAQGDQQTQTCILVAEDSPLVRNALVGILQNSGISNDRILQAEDGQHAIEIYEQNKARIAAVLTDHDMPNKNGLELLTHIYNDAQGTKPMMMMQSSRFTRTGREDLENHNIIAAVDDMNAICIAKGDFCDAHIHLIQDEMNKEGRKTPQAETIAPEFITTPGV